MVSQDSTSQDKYYRPKRDSNSGPRTPKCNLNSGPRTLRRNEQEKQGEEVGHRLKLKGTQ